MKDKTVRRYLITVHTVSHKIHDNINNNKICNRNNNNNPLLSFELNLVFVLIWYCSFLDTMYIVLKTFPTLCFRNGSFWLVVSAGAISAGVLGVWASVLDVNLKPRGITQVCQAFGF